MHTTRTLRAANVPAIPLHMHDSDQQHLHEISADARGVISEIIWNIENIELTTVGIDIGSSTSHLMFARVRMQRRTQHLSSHFVVVHREILWRSPILLTPFLADDTIDAAALGDFLARSYADAGITPAVVDSGAVILTGEAIRKHNADSIAQIFAADAGKFVCASAGHQLECVLAAHGSGAVALSRQEQCTILNVDIGGGTTKVALIRNGDIVATCAIAVGGRLLAFDSAGRLTRIDDSARRVAEACGITLRAGHSVSVVNVMRVIDALARAVIDTIAGGPGDGIADRLMLTPALPRAARPDAITFSGGVAEYIYGRETRAFDDIAIPLARSLRQACDDGEIQARVRDPGQGIRATVIGASQFAVQVSGKTIHLDQDALLPVHNVPVLTPDVSLAGGFTAEQVAAAIGEALRTHDRDIDASVAIAFTWHGEPLYARVRQLAEGIELAAAGSARDALLIVVVDADLARTLGHILHDELRLSRTLVVIDGLALRELDYIDIGRLMEPANVLPVVVKSLLFPSGQRYFRSRGPVRRGA